MSTPRLSLYYETTPARTIMAADEAHAAGLPPKGMEGVWFNTDAGTGEISKIVIARYTRKKHRHACLWANSPEPIDWGKHR